MPGNSTQEHAFRQQLVGVAAGASSGTTKLLVGHPFDTVKIRLQTTTGLFASPLHCLRETLVKEGVRGLYKGATPPLVGWVVMDSVQWGALTYFRRLISATKPDGKLGLLEHGGCGFGSGMVPWLCRVAQRHSVL